MLESTLALDEAISVPSSGNQYDTKWTHSASAVRSARECGKTLRKMRSAMVWRAWTWSARSGGPNSGTRLERSTLDWVTSDGEDPESSEKTEANCASGGDRRGSRYHDLVRGTIFCEHRRARESAGGH